MTERISPPQLHWYRVVPRLQAVLSQFLNDSLLSLSLHTASIRGLGALPLTRVEAVASEETVLDGVSPHAAHIGRDDAG